MLVHLSGQALSVKSMSGPAGGETRVLQRLTMIRDKDAWVAGTVDRRVVQEVARAHMWRQRVTYSLAVRTDDDAAQEHCTAGRAR